MQLVWTRCVSRMLKVQLFLALIFGFIGRDESRRLVPTNEVDIAPALPHALPYEDCGSKFDIVYLTISSCTTIPCEMVRGSTVLVHTVFNDNGIWTEFLKHSVRWIFNAVKKGATISPDPCDGQHQCITDDFGGKSYWAEVFVNHSLPVTRGTMVWQAGNEQTKDLICFKIPVFITLEQD